MQPEGPCRPSPGFSTTGGTPTDHSGMGSKPTRPGPSRLPQRWFSPWLLAAAGLLFIPALVYCSLTYEPAKELRYGQFKQMLARGEVHSAKVGPSRIVGELKPRGGEGPRPQFRTS